MVAEQLRCAGVLEAIRVSRSAFPNRLPHKEVLQRFGLLAHRAGVDLKAALTGKDSAATANACKEVLHCLVNIGRDDAEKEGAAEEFQVGRTRVYFEAGVLERLEEQRQVALQKVRDEDFGILRRVSLLPSLDL